MLQFILAFGARFLLLGFERLSLLLLSWHRRCRDSDQIVELSCSQSPRRALYSICRCCCCLCSFVIVVVIHYLIIKFTNLILSLLTLCYRLFSCVSVYCRRCRFVGPLALQFTSFWQYKDLAVFTVANYSPFSKLINVSVNFTFIIFALQSL